MEEESVWFEEKGNFLACDVNGYESDSNRIYLRGVRDRLGIGIGFG